MPLSSKQDVLLNPNASFHPIICIFWGIPEEGRRNVFLNLPTSFNLTPGQIQLGLEVVSYLNWCYNQFI
jgi:hypothetical protein